MTSLRARGLGKGYRLYERPIDSLKEWVFRRPYHTPFWALRDVSFEVPVGGTFGVIGSNGAGKTTLLRLLAGTIQPSEGILERDGRVAGLLELGSGFHPDLTGRENLRLGCAVVGLSPSETVAVEPDIIGFSELGEFIDRPVKTYSTGMYMRLSFSVATTVDPDILVIDEALSVGDQHFQKKCVDRMTAFRDAGKTLVFCSHQMYFVSRLCAQSVWLRNGQIELMGPTAEVVQEYQDYERGRDVDNPAPAPATAAPGAPLDEKAKTTYLTEVELEGAAGRGIVSSGARIEVRTSARVDPAVREDVSLALSIRRADGVRCCSMRGDLYRSGPDMFSTRLVFDAFPLLSGQYEVDVFLMDRQGVLVYDIRQAALTMTVRDDGSGAGLVRIPHRWERP